MTHAVPESEAAASAAPPLALKILLVEDAQAVAQIFSLLLRQMGHQVEVAAHAEAALERLAAFHPDLIFSDISMPGMSGYELAQQLRRQPQFQSLTLIAMSGYGQPEDRALAQQAGFDDYLVKPAELPHLEAILARAQARRAAAPTQPR